MLDDAASAAYYQWQPPGKAIAVSLSLAVIGRLGSSVLEDGEPFPHRRPEIGGFLWGSVKRSRGVAVVQVDGFEPVECEHAFGPSYFLSGADQNRLAERLRRYRPPRGTSIVGFFRSNTRKEFALAVEDINLMARYFSKPSMVLLLVHSSSDGALRAGFSIWEQRAIRTLKPYLEFPFEPAILFAGGYEISGREHGRALAAPSPPPVRRQIPAPSPAAPLEGANTSLVRRPTGLAAPMRSQPAPVWVDARSGQAPRLGTVAHFSRLWRGPMRLEWLVAAAAVGIALLGGVLHRDTRPLESGLPPAMQGKHVAARANQDADRTEPSVAAAPPAPAAAVPLPAAPLAPEAPARLSETPVLAAAVPAAPPVSQPEPIVQSGPPTAPRAVAIPIAPLRVAAVSAPPLPAPPNIALEPPKAPAPLLSDGGILPAGIRGAPDPFVRIAVDPLPGHRKLLGKLFSGKKVGTVFEPPRLLDERPPEVPSELRDRIRGSVPITVKLYVNRTGSVEYAELLSDGTGQNRDLAALAVFASRKWQFAPARQGGEAIPAEVLVQFRFGAGANQPERLVAGQRGGTARSTQ
ncbi:MAG TPA: hypothetical protein VMA31_18060 [Bryobacteraceae bacterium]|nr:hypothetical protein [Bryobacteraceae bacterium]